VGPDFNPQKQEQSVFRSLAAILMISRVVLGFQYMFVLYEVWYYKNTKLPLVLIVTATSLLLSSTGKLSCESETSIFQSQFLTVRSVVSSQILRRAVFLSFGMLLRSSRPHLTLPSHRDGKS
jgi:hypothetical protein